MRPKSVVRRGFPLFLVLPLLAFIGACGDEDDGAESIGTLTLGDWATRYCEIHLDLDAVFAESADGVDETRLTVEERKERVDRIRAVLVPEIREHADEMAKLKGPANADRVATAWIEAAEAVADAYETAGEAIQEAETATDIEAANAQLGVDLVRANQEFHAAVRDADRDGEVVVALTSVTNCGPE